MSQPAKESVEETRKQLRVAFIHPDLGIGGAERLVVDAALGLQTLGHTVDLYTSHHDPAHCFSETRDGTLSVKAIHPPFPRSLAGKLHILFAHLRQLHLTLHLLFKSAPVAAISSSSSPSSLAESYDVFFVDQLSTCVPLLRTFAQRRVVFYCHFPDKLLADGEYVEGALERRSRWSLKAIYRGPMDWFEETTTGQADYILANSKFTASVFRAQFPSIKVEPKIVYPGINFAAYDASKINTRDPEITQVASDRPTLLSLNRFEKKKNARLAIEAFASLLSSKMSSAKRLRLVIAGGYDPRLEDNRSTFYALITAATTASLTYTLLASNTPLPASLPPSAPHSCEGPDVLFLLNFSTPQRTALLSAPSTLALLYTPTNEHFGIVPVEAMYAGLPVLACASGGPTESVLAEPFSARTGWLCPPDVDAWTAALREIVGLEPEQRVEIGKRAKARASELFGMDAMAEGIEATLREAVAKGPVPREMEIEDVAYWIILVVSGVLSAGLLAYVLIGTLTR